MLGTAGNDKIVLAAGETFVSGPGDDDITGVAGGYAFWGAPGPVSVDLAHEVAQDGYGGTDQVRGITVLHLPRAGARVLGSGADEEVFSFGGASWLDMGGGNDTVHMYQIASTAYTVRWVGNTVLLKGKDHTLELKNVESLRFSDRSYQFFERGTSDYFKHMYDVFSFVETELSQGWWYAGVYNPPQLVSYIPQAVRPFDIGADLDDDLVIPLNKGYRTGVDTRDHFQVLENDNGVLRFNETLTEATPFIAGSRRTETIFLERYGTHALVSVAHDTAIETETRYDIPWRYGDISISLAAPFKDVADELVPDRTLPKSNLTGRDTAVDAHSLAVGDVNGDGLDDILVGEFGSVFYLQQTTAGPFVYRTSSFLQSLVHTWKEPTLTNAAPGVLIDLNLNDLNGDGFDDLVVGWGHATGLSRIFFNDGKGDFSESRSVALPETVYGPSNNLHMKTFSEDFNRDGDIDLVVLRTRFDPFYGGNYLQFLENTGAGRFVDATAARFGDPVTMEDTFLPRLHWTDFWQVLDVNNDGALDIAGHSVGGQEGTAFVWVNDGKGYFDRVEIPGSPGRPVVWGDYDGDGRIEVVTFSSRLRDALGSSSTNTFAVYEMKDGGVSNGVAYDLSGNAGKVARTLGAVFGPDSVQNEGYAGIGLDLVDKGMGYEELMGLALQVRLGSAPSHAAVVDLLYTNVVGLAPSQAEREFYVGLLDSGAYSSASLGVLAADTPMNATNINLVGLTQTGLAYLPL